MIARAVRRLWAAVTAWMRPEVPRRTEIWQRLEGVGVKRTTQRQG